MSIDLTFEERNEYLHVQVTGVLTLNDAQEGLRKTLAAVAIHNPTLILIEGLALQPTMDAMEYFHLGEFVANELVQYVVSSRTHKLRVAFVCHPTLFDREHFSDTVATNRGADVWSFDNIPDAFKWLMQNPD